MDNRERGSHARGVYPVQDTSRVGTVRMKQEEEAESSKKSRRKARGHKGGKSSTKDLTIELYQSIT